RADFLPEDEGVVDPLHPARMQIREVGVKATPPPIASPFGERAGPYVPTDSVGTHHEGRGDTVDRWLTDKTRLVNERASWRTSLAKVALTAQPKHGRVPGLVLHSNASWQTTPSRA